MTQPIGQQSNSQSSRLLNIGCGRRYHSAWTNLDLESSDPRVIQHNVIDGVPFEANQFELVYHSHILEHLTPEQGQRLVSECYRVLRPGGVLRIVVPDLERIARLYLETHGEAWKGEEESKTHYRWMKLELLDQLVREKSGGRMGSYMAGLELEESGFVRSRIGDELKICRTGAVDDEPNPPSKGSQTALRRIIDGAKGVRQRIARQTVRWLMGTAALRAFDEGLFRSQGEIHRWMYDRYSLRELCSDSGFVNFRVCTADESRIDGYSEFELDAVEGQSRKPDSIYIECEKPELAGRLQRAG